MTTQLVFNETFENVENAVRAAMTESGLDVRPTPMGPGVEVKAKMGFWLGEKGNKLLSLVLPFLFKVEGISAVIAAYQDGTTALTLRESGSTGGTLGAGVLSAATGGMGLAGDVTNLAASGAVDAADAATKAAALSKLFAAVDAKVRDKLGAKIAHEGPPRPDAVQVSV
jgi:hypothetical protein